MQIILTINNTEISAELYDNPVAEELARQLPLELTFHDYNNVEKVAILDEPLRLRDVPGPDAPAPGEIGYYSPDRGLVLYYESPGSWPGLVRLGRFDYDLTALRELADGTQIRITAA